MAENKRKPPMGGSRRGMAPGEKAKDFKGTLSTLIKKYLAPYKFALIVVVIFAIASTVFSIVGPKILGNATTEMFTGIVSKIQGGPGINYIINSIYSKCFVWSNSRVNNDTSISKINI